MSLILAPNCKWNELYSWFVKYLSKVDASRFTRGKKNTQVDPENVSILDIVPEMYTPNPTYGAAATGAACTELANVTKKEYKIPDCMPWNIYDGKILFRLSSYEYSRSRAHQEQFYHI